MFSFKRTVELFIAIYNTVPASVKSVSGQALLFIQIPFLTVEYFL